MSHDHHRCECKHERVRYCARCRVCHCLDCSQEWGASYTYTAPYWNTWGTLTVGGTSSGCITGSACNGANVTPTGCNHA
jgi:hypothetical protein